MGLIEASPTSGVQNGSIGGTCVQAYPLWILNGSSILAKFLATGQEDCLFLDVYVPANVTKDAAVMVWIYGGGYVLGSKDNHSPVGLLQAASSYGDMIFVALNYRLGAFGFLAGPTVINGGVANAGLLDQRFALEWVQENIAKFGGNPNNVTVMGESAGGGSVMHQITA
jgi:carboxylesterase type B